MKVEQQRSAPSSSWERRGDSWRCCLREAGPCTEDQELSEISVLKLPPGEPLLCWVGPCAGAVTKSHRCSCC